MSFFLYFLKQINMNDKIKLHNLSIELKPLQVFSILSIFNIEAIINSRNILANKMDFGKVLIFLLFRHLLVHHKQSTALVNLYVISSF